MTSFEVLSTVAAFLGIGVNLVLFGAFLLQLRELRHQVRDARIATERDHARRRAEATINFYRDTIEKRLALREKLPDERDAPEIARIVRDAAARPEGIEAYTIKEYLSFLEMLATGVRTEVMDLDVMDRLAGSRIAAAARNYRPWIERRRESLADPRLYEELVELGQSIDVRRGWGSLPSH